MRVNTSHNSSRNLQYNFKKQSSSNRMHTVWSIPYIFITLCQEQLRKHCLTYQHSSRSTEPLQPRQVGYINVVLFCSYSSLKYSTKCAILTCFIIYCKNHFTLINEEQQQWFQIGWSNSVQSWELMTKTFVLSSVGIEDMNLIQWSHWYESIE